MRRKRVGSTLSILLIAAGTALLVGCVYVPWVGSPRTPTGTRVSSLLTRRDDGKPLRVGIATEEMVRRWLGVPAARSADGRAAAYGYTVTTGAWLTLCGAFDTRKTRYLFLRFDADGTLGDWRWQDCDQPVGRCAAWLAFEAEMKSAE